MGLFSIIDSLYFEISVTLFFHSDEMNASAFPSQTCDICLFGLHKKHHCTLCLMERF